MIPRTVDHEKFASALKAVAYPNRLRLLLLLREPKTIDEIRLTPAAARGPGSADRPISRQAVLDHLHQLEEQGLVRSSTAQRGRRSTQLEYVAVRSQLYAMVESFRELVETPMANSVGPQETVLASARFGASEHRGARLVLVHGATPGRVFPLMPHTTSKDRGWIIGRKDGSHVCLDYDPFVSSENAEILRRPEGFALLDLRTAKNGTFLNMMQLPVGGTSGLRQGDIIGVGRSLLVFHDA